MITKERSGMIAGGGLALALAILVLLGSMIYREITATRAAAREVDHTYIVLQGLDEVFSALKDAETGQRGYVITGEKKYLGPYFKATGDLDHRLSALRELTRDSPRQQKTLDGIELIMRKKMALLNETIESRRAKGYRDASRIVETGIGEKLMDEIRAKVDDARDEETRLLHERSVARTTAARSLIGAVLAGGSLSLALLLTAFFFLKGEIRRRTKVEEELRRHQESLERLVAERTFDLESANVCLMAEVGMRKQAEEDLKKTMDDLARSNRELDYFAAIASHDLQSPLRAVTGFIELLRERYEGKLDEKADEYIARAASGARRMSVLIHDLYVYSRVGTRGKQFSTVDMGAQLKAALDDLREVIDKNGAVITFDELPRADGDDTQLVQLFQNLIGNAIKFRKKDVPPRIRISVERKQKDWVFGVHDNGIGIDPRFYDRVFVIFQRLHRSEEFPGTGLGLALCKKIVERHGGRIWIESGAGEGSSFYFTMPAVFVQELARAGGAA